MRNLWAFLSKYNAFFLLLIFEIIAFTIYVKYNSFQKATFINSANEVTGNLYARVNSLNRYLSLGETNDSLARENARLRSQLKTSFYADTALKKDVTDTVYHQQFSYVVARVINNSVNRRNNYLTLNKGTLQGIGKDMGVITSSGVVGVVVAASEHFALVRSFLHKDSRLNAMLADDKEIGTVQWGDETDPHKALLVDVSNHVKAHIGEPVVTSGYSAFFPSGIPIGKVSSLHTKGGGFSLNMEINLAVDFSKLQYVYVITNKFAQEQTGLEAQQKKDE